MGQRQRTQELRCRPSRFVSSLIVLSMVKQGQTSLASLSTLHESVAQHSGAPCACSSLAHRLDDKEAIGFSPYSCPRRLAYYVFAFHDSEELGPRMLARISKRTGLKPEEL